MGKRVLVVEDDLLAAAPICDDLRDNGAVVLGPAPTVHYAELLLLGRGVDAAVLDVRLHGGTVFGLAQALMARHVPFVFTSGLPRDSAPNEFRDVPWLQKPVEGDALLSAMADRLEAALPPAVPLPRPKSGSSTPIARPSMPGSSRRQDRWWRAIAHGFMR